MNMTDMNVARTFVRALVLGACGGLVFALGACGGPAQGPDDERTGEPDRAAEAGAMDDTSGMDGMQGMDGDDEAGATVRLRPGQAERIGLRWTEVTMEPLRRTTRTSAVVEYPESEMVWVSPRISGWVERLHVTFEGAAVRRGEPLLEIYSPDLVTAQEELLLARRLEDDLSTGRIARGGDSLIAVARRRLAYWDISETQIERLLETGEVRKTLTLHAPATGIVTKKQVFEGQGVKAGENLLMISPTDPVWVDASVYEQDLPFVREGMPVEVDVEGLPGESVQGRVTFLYPQLRENSRTLKARIELPNPGGRLRPGMYATVRIESRSAEPVLSVPSSAILHTGTRDVAFMDIGDNRLMPMIVRTGRVGDERIEVLEGLSEGDRVATSAQFLLDSESNLMEAMQGMMAQLGRTATDDPEGMEGMDMDPAEAVKDSADDREMP
jgi:multidrug efflux pump subunit AcrA (membrane-fusion protein)